MSIEITLEADARLKRTDVIAALEACGVDEVKENEKNLTASFSLSKMSFFFSEDMEMTPPLTEGMEERKWIIGARIVFRYYVKNFDECELDLQKFIQKLAELSEAFFVVAFQYEGIRAIRDQNGLEFFNSRGK